VKNSQDEYIPQSRFSDPGTNAHLLDPIPSCVAEVCSVVQGLLLNIFTAPFYHVGVPQHAHRNADIEVASDILSGIVVIDPRSLLLARAPQSRLPVVCRQFAILTCAILRHKGIPARVRSGFADYLSPGARIGHTLCEYWRPDRSGWVRIDPQIDAVHKERLKIDFSPLDIPAMPYLCGAEAWRAFRTGVLPIEVFQGGTANLRNLLCLDLLELNAMETHGCLPPLIGSPGQAPSESETAMLDDLSRRIVDEQSSFGAMRRLYESDSCLRPAI
jgi:hypothetical protein